MVSKFIKAAALVAAGSILAPSLAVAQSVEVPNKCRFFEHFDYEGEMFELHTGHTLMTKEGPTVSEEYSSGPDYQNFVAPEWAERISALQVAPSCVADVVTDVSGVSIDQDLSQFDENYNDEVVLVGCRCQ